MRPVLLALALLLAACGDAPVPASQRAQAKRERNAAVHEALATRVRQVPLPGGELTLVEVPVADDEGLTLSRQRCFIWRDARLATTAISCPSRDVYVGP